jgi:hypothetical protein
MTRDEDAKVPPHIITFSFIKKGVPTKKGYCGKPIMIHPEEKPLWGAIVKGPSTLTYDHKRLHDYTTRLPDKAQLALDASVEFEPIGNPVPQKIQFPHCHCVIIQRNKANNAVDDALLTMHEYTKPKKEEWAGYGTKRGNSQYARQIRFPGMIWILFTRGPAPIGSSSGEGAYLWIESLLPPEKLQ